MKEGESYKMRNCRWLLLMAMVAGVGSAQTPGAPEYACVEVNGNVLETFNIVRDGACPKGQTRMLVVARKRLGFAASAPLVATENQVAFLGGFWSGPITLSSVDALMIAVTLDVMTDRGLYTIPDGLACVPLVDGKPAGDPLALTPPGRDLIGLGGGSPYTMWSIVREATVSAKGAHMVAMECAAASAFYFRGQGTLTVLQQIPGN